MMVYLAGPITERNEYRIEDNVARAVDVYCSLLAEGLYVYCPALGHPVDDPRVPDTMWYKLGIHFLRHSTHVLMLPRWQESVGARAEHAVASDIGKLIFYDEDSLRASLGIRPRVQPANIPT